MPASPSRLAYQDCEELYELAAADPRGIRVKLTVDEATYLRLRMHQCRSINRKDNATTYDPTHPLHGRSEWDKFQLTIEDHGPFAYLYIKAMKLGDLRIENLSSLGKPQEPSLDLTVSDTGDGYDAEPATVQVPQRRI